MRLILVLLLVASAGGSSEGNEISQLRDAGPGAFADDNTTLAALAAALEGREESDETDDKTEEDRNRLFPKMPKCENFDLPCSILVFSIALVCFLVALACALCYAMHNKRHKLVPCDAYCTCPAHANV